MCDTMDWDLISEQIVSHVEECLPKDAPLLSTGLPEEDTSRINAGSLDTEDSALGAFEHRPSLEVSGRMDPLTEDLHRGQAATNGAVGARGGETGRDVTEAIQAMHRIKLVEERMSDQDNAFAHYRILSSRADGAMVALQRQQAQLDTDVCELRDMLATTDRRCLKAESALHETVGQAQVIDAVRSIVGPLREQVQARLSHLEIDSCDIRNALGHSSTREVSSEIETRMSAALSAETQRSQVRYLEVKELMGAMAIAERKRHEEEAAGLRELVDELSRDVKSGQTRWHRTETKVKELESTVRSLEKRLTVGEAEVTARIRRELEDSEAGVRRRIDEVRATDVRRIDDICSDLVRDKHSRLQERAEVAQEISDVRSSLHRTEQHWQGRSHELLNRLEVSMASTANESSRARCSISAISSQLKQLQLEVQGINDRYTHDSAQNVFKERHQEPEDAAIGGHPVLLTRSLAPLPQVDCSESNRNIPKRALESGNNAQMPAERQEENTPFNKATKDRGVEQNAIRVCAPPASAQAALSYADAPPLPQAENPNSVTPDHIPPTPTTDTQGNIDRRCRSGEGDGSLDALEEELRDLSEEESQTNGGVGQSGDVVPAPTVKVEHQELPRGDVDEARAPPSRENGDEEEIRVAQANSLRRSALAAVSRLADEEEQQETSSDDGRNTPARRLGNQSPAQSSSPSSPTLSCVGEPLQSHQAPRENGDQLPGASVLPGAPPNALVVNSAEVAEKNPMAKSGADGFSSSAIGGFGVGEGKRHSESVMDSTERDSDTTSSSFSEDEGMAKKASARPQQKPVSEHRNDEGRPWQMNRSSPFGTRKPNNSVRTPTQSKEPSSSGTGAAGGESDVGAEGAGCQGAEEEAPPPQNRRGRAPPPPPPRVDYAVDRRRSATGSAAGPAPISLRARSASKESGVVTAQCEFCLRRYLKAAMGMHLQACELRLVRCPYQCGTKVLVRNLEGHKNSCSMRQSAELKEDVDSTDNLSASTASPSAGTREPSLHEAAAGNNNETKNEDGRYRKTGQKAALAIGPGDAGRTVTCMRCHESLPFLLVPSHGPKCKGNKADDSSGEGAQGMTPGTLAATNQRRTPPSESRDPPATAAERRSPSSSSSPISVQAPTVRASRPPLVTTGIIPSSLSLPPPICDGGSTPPKYFPGRSGLSPRSPSTSPKPWQAESRIGTVLPPSVRVPPSPPRPKDVRSWGTRQVTSWLRETMRPPRADVISRFHERGVVGTTLLGVTDRYLMDLEEGMGINDEGIRAQLLEAIASLED